MNLWEMMCFMIRDLCLRLNPRTSSLLEDLKTTAGMGKVGKNIGTGDEGFRCLRSLSGFESLSKIPEIMVIVSKEDMLYELSHLFMN